MNSFSNKNLITAKDLVDVSDRTLLFGYQTDRSEWHVYLKSGEIHTLSYFNNNDLEEIAVENNEDYVPKKRLYPECCDFEFCRLLKQNGISLSFTNWNSNQVEKIYYGRILCK